MVEEKEAVLLFDMALEMQRYRTISS